MTVKPKPDAKYPPTGLAENIHKLPQWIQDGCGDEEYFNLEKNATFLGSHMPDTLPDLTNHNSYFSEAMKANPDLYQQLKDKKTSLGVTLGHCIKTGIDNPGHPHIKTVGMVAGDEESYELFAPLFDPGLCFDIFLYLKSVNAKLEPRGPPSPDVRTASKT